jgi:hypothetical protein
MEEQIKTFIKNQIELYKQENFIEIKIGKIISDNIFKLKLMNTLKYVKEFRDYKLRYSQGKIYKYKDLIYKTFNNKNNENRKTELLEKEMILGDNFDILIINSIVKNTNVFPNLNEYDDEQEYDEISVYFDKYFILKFLKLNEEQFINIEIKLEKDIPYTYQDEMIKNISYIFSKLGGCLTSSTN